MSDTPRTDAAAVGLGRLLIEPGKTEWTELVPADFARQLERELADAEQRAFRSGVYVAIGIMSSKLSEVAAIALDPEFASETPDTAVPPAAAP